MEGDKQTKRISIEQRELMLDFMERHTALATGKFTTPDGAKHKARLLKELANQLNSCSSGVSKPDDKWLKSWQDWRSDVKAKASLLKREMRKTGGGQICSKAKPLSALEERLLRFLGPNLAMGHEDVLDILEERLLDSQPATNGSPEVEDFNLNVQDVPAGCANFISIPLDGPISIGGVVNETVTDSPPEILVASNQSSNPPSDTLQAVLHVIRPHIISKR